MKCLTKRAQIASLCEILLAERVTKYRASDGVTKSHMSFDKISLTTYIPLRYDILFFNLFEAHIASGLIISVENALI